MIAVSDPIHQPRQTGEQLPGQIRLRRQFRSSPEDHSSGALHPDPRPIVYRRDCRISSRIRSQSDGNESEIWIRIGAGHRVHHGLV